MNGAQEKARLEEERRRQEVHVLCVASSLMLGSNWQLAKRWEGVASFVACAGSGGAPESPRRGRGSPGGRAKLRTSTRYKDQHIIDFVANGRRTHAWRRSGSDRRFHARLQSSLWWSDVLACVCQATVLRILLYRDAGGSGASQTRGAPQS